MLKNKFKYLVADTTAFINNVQLNNYAENILTVPDVVNEVKNKRQIRRLVVLPFDLQVREPNSECLVYVTQFAKKTGDFPSLSSIDLKVIALTYELEKENVGTEHLRKEPIISKTIASKNKPDVFVEKTLLAGFYKPKNKKFENENDFENIKEFNSNEEKTSESNENDKKSLDSGEFSADESDEEAISDESDNAEEDLTEKEIQELRESLEKLMSNTEDIKDDTILISEKNLDQNQPNENNISKGNFEYNIKSEDDDNEDEVDEANDDNDDDNVDTWITPSNIKQIKNNICGNTEEDSNAIVACMSTDFAIQNVLKQINLNIAALDGKIIKHLKTYILRCYACFKTTSIMTKIFCPNCGNKTLKRVAVSLDENGQQVIHINTRRPLTAKYKNQSLPRFKGGKHSRNPILFEDQPIPKQMPSRVAKTKTCPLDEDYIAGISPFVLRDVDSKSAILRTKGNIKQWARNNAYEEQRRKKQFNRLIK